MAPLWRIGAYWGRQIGAGDSLMSGNHLEILPSHNKKSMKIIGFWTGKMAFTLCPVWTR